MAGLSYLIDTNVLLRWIKPDDRDYPCVVSAIEVMLRDGAALCYTSQNVAEFWSVCTRPVARNGYALSPREAGRRARFFEEKLRLLSDSPLVHEEWRKLIVAHQVSGAKVYDARLVAVMRIHGVTQILTFNGRDFARYSDIEAVHPQAISTKQP